MGSSGSPEAVFIFKPLPVTGGCPYWLFKDKCCFCGQYLFCCPDSEGVKHALWSDLSIVLLSKPYLWSNTCPEDSMSSSFPFALNCLFDVNLFNSLHVYANKVHFCPTTKHSETLAHQMWTVAFFQSEICSHTWWKSLRCARCRWAETALGFHLWSDDSRCQVWTKHQTLTAYGTCVTINRGRSIRLACGRMISDDLWVAGQQDGCQCNMTSQHSTSSKEGFVKLWWNSLFPHAVTPRCCRLMIGRHQAVVTTRDWSVSGSCLLWVATDQLQPSVIG